jgi:hypothetical protein
MNNLSTNNFELDRFNVFHMRESLGALPDMEAENNLILKRVTISDSLSWSIFELAEPIGKQD